MNFSLNQNEIEFLLKVLGELPTRTGAFILLQNLENQYKQHVAQTSSEVSIQPED